MEWIWLSLAVICKSCRDVCMWNWASSIFYPITYFRHDWERKYNPLTGERLSWFGIIPIPALFFDGFHLFEWLLWAFIGLALYSADGLRFIDLIRIGILVAVVHYITYKKLLRRSFWKR